MNKVCKALDSRESEVEELYIVNCILNAFLSYATIMLNSVTIYALRKVSSLPKQLKTLLFNLVVSDLCFGLIVQPFLIISVVGHYTTVCEFYSVFVFFAGFLSSASLFGITALSLDRFLAIHLHLRYQELVTHKRVVTAVILSWVFSALLSSLSFLISSKDRHVIFSVINLSCIVLATVVFIRIFVVLRRHNNQVQVQQMAAQSSGHDQIPHLANLGNSATVALYIYLVFLFCYLPRTVDFFVLGIGLDGSEETIALFSIYSWTLTFLNSSLNPIIYCWKMSNIRRAIINILRRVYQRQN